MNTINLDNKKNFLLEGDCRLLMKDIPDNSIKLIIADPPYGGILNESWDKFSVESFISTTKEWLIEAKRILTDDGSIYIWSSIGPKSYKFFIENLKIVTEMFYLQDMIVWNKQRGRGSRKGYLFTREECCWLTKSEKNYIWNKENQYSTIKYADCWIKRLKKEDNPYKRITNVWSDINEVSIETAKKSGCKGDRKMLHPCQKPVSLMDRIILAHTNENDYILDPFAGSGTVGESCRSNNRFFILIENNKDYINIIKNRLNI